MKFIIFVGERLFSVTSNTNFACSQECSHEGLFFYAGRNRVRKFCANQILKKEMQALKKEMEARRKKEQNKEYYKKKKLEKWYVHNILLCTLLLKVMSNDSITL